MEMELSDTIEMMGSSDYKERFKAEYYQLKIRHDKLEIMIDKYKKDELSFTPVCPLDTYRNQYFFMHGYLLALEKRAKLEAIEL